MERLLEDSIGNFENSYEKARAKSGVAERAIDNLLKYEAGIEDELPASLKEDGPEKYIEKQLEAAFNYFEEALEALEETTDFQNEGFIDIQEVENCSKKVALRGGTEFMAENFARELENFKGVVNYATQNGIGVKPKLFRYHDRREMAESLVGKKL